MIEYYNFNYLIRAVSNQFIFLFQMYRTWAAPTLMGFYPEFSGNVSDKTEEFVLIMQNNFMPSTALSGKCSWITADRDVHTLLHMCRLSCPLPQMKLVVCVNEISSTPLQPWCSRDGDCDTLQQAAFAD